MKWIIAPQTRVEIHAFTGLNLSGNRSVAQIYPAGGRQGKDIDGARLRSVAVAGLPGTRVVFSSTVAARLSRGSSAPAGVVSPSTTTMAMSLVSNVTGRSRGGPWASWA